MVSIPGFSVNVRSHTCKRENRLNEKKWWNRELTLKCKLRCYVKPIGVSPNKGNQGTTHSHLNEKKTWFSYK